MGDETQPDSAGESSALETLVASHEGEESSERPDQPEPGAGAPRIGRFSILRRVGAGAMGVVYAGYDETLDRKVAIKLLRRARARDRARLQREAQGLARLSHPNVVQIYEIGEHEGASFLAMEFVEGETLSAWLERDAEPAWRRRLARLIEAGRGLAAAHQKGLVHRDFKPDNVMIDEQGRVRVMDFGLVRGEDEDPVEADAGAHVPGPIASAGLTQTGALMGTPAYMAPEQHEGRAVDARSDQFSFCVTLWEALYGERPFQGDNLAQLYLAASEGTIAEPPRGAAVPGWVRRILERGLAPDPEQRWASMSELLAALGRDPTRRRRALFAALAVVGLALAGVALERVRAETERAEALAACEAEAASVDEVWNEEVARELEQAFAATELGLAGEAWARTSDTLARYAEGWSARRREICVEAELEGSRGSASQAAATACLEQGRAALGATVDILATVDAELVPRGPGLAHELPRLEPCLDERALARRSSPPPAHAAELEQLRERLVRARLLILSARHEQAGAALETLSAAAEELGWAPFEAEVGLAMGSLQRRLGDYDAAEATLREAFARAGESAADEHALAAATELTRLVGFDQARHAEGLLWSTFAATLLARLGLEGEVAEALLLNETATVISETGDYERSTQLYAQGLEILEAKLGAANPTTASVAHNLGTDIYLLGRYDEAERRLRRALELREQALGPHHPQVAQTLTNLGNVVDELGRYDEAQAMLERSLAIREAVFGPDHPSVAASLHTLGAVELHQDRPAQAQRAFERALAIRERVHGPDSPRLAGLLSNIGMIASLRGQHELALARFERALELSTPGTLPYALILGNVGETQSQLGRDAEAEELLLRSLALYEELHGAEHANVAGALRRLGQLEMRRDRPRAALDYLERARAMFEATVGPEHVETAGTLVYLGKAQLELGEVELALASLRRGLELEEAAGARLLSLADTRFALARALWATGEQTRARSLGEQARGDFVRGGRGDLAAEVEAWLDGR